jgi:His/Glu/Gln/Arg/opine family amino acid ABC transporter permease subunit
MFGLPLGDWLAYLSQGLFVTLELSVISAALAFLLAASLSIARLSPSRAIRVFARTETDIVRSIPLLAMLLFFYFGIGPHVYRLGIDEFWLAVIALSLTESAYLAEVYRGALEAVSPKQWEAATSMGMSWRQVIRHVVLPQAVLPSIPTTVNALIATIKDSSLASLIAVGELTLSATILVSNTFKPFEVYVVLGAMYLAVIVPLGLLAAYSEQWVERRLGAQAMYLQRTALDISADLATLSINRSPDREERAP